MKKIVFVESELGNPNNVKRMEEFKSRGYDVEAYAFYREINSKNIPDGIEIHNLGSFSSNSSYFSRVGIMRKGLKSVIKRHKNDDCIFYLFGGDVALLFPKFSSKPYVFEEADMTHQNIKYSVVRNFLEYKIKRIIRKSLMSTFCSDGFIQFHFGDNRPDNVCVIPNRLHPNILNLPMTESKQFDENCIQFGFVGSIRYQTIFSFASYLLKNFTQHQFHFFGNYPTKETEAYFSVLAQYPNCHFHGPFKSPIDLPGIYCQIDVVLSAYDVRGINPRYAEPNKLYEAIFFEKPIIVSSNSFLADKVAKLGIGYDVNALNEKDVVDLIKSINDNSIKRKMDALKVIDKKYCISSNDQFFTLLEKRFNK